MNYPWNHKRRFNAYSNHVKNTFGSRIQKVSIDAGFTCPNRDGAKGTGGCTFCNNNAFNPSYCHTHKPISQQIQKGIDFHKTRYKKADKYLAYFQAYSNTYASLNQLQKIYNEALTHTEIAGIVIGTRPDCIDEEKLRFFAELSEKTYVIIEYGIESCYNRTLKRINRGHSFEDSVKAIQRTRNHGIKTGGHIIFGLPGESREEMLNMALILSEVRLNNIKFHQLQIIKNTAMEKEYKDKYNDFEHFSLYGYLDFLIEFIENLRPDIVIERIAGEVPPKFNVGTKWHMRYDQILTLFEDKLEAKDTWQGKFYKK